jgi:hypothetical protein
MLNEFLNEGRDDEISTLCDLGWQRGERRRRDDDDGSGDASNNSGTTRVPTASTEPASTSVS